MQNYISITIAIFIIVGVLHLLRALFGWQVLIHTYSVPRTLSFLAALVAFLLSLWGFAQLS